MHITGSRRKTNRGQDLDFNTRRSSSSPKMVGPRHGRLCPHFGTPQMLFEFVFPLMRLGPEKYVGHQTGKACASEVLGLQHARLEPCLRPFPISSRKWANGLRRSCGVLGRMTRWAFGRCLFPISFGIGPSGCEGVVGFLVSAGRPPGCASHPPREEEKGAVGRQSIVNIQ